MSAAGGRDPLQHVLSRLPDARPNGKGHMARCPAHDDRQASLSVGVGSEGRVLLKCFAGCEPAAVLRAIDLSMTDLFPRRGHQANGAGAAKRTAPKREVATYDYTDANGALLYQVVRYEPKDFRQRRPVGNDGWAWDLKGVERVLYRLPEVLEAVRQREGVYLVEGEKDADALAALGVTATTCAGGGGAGKWSGDYTKSLRGADVVIMPDNDVPGRKHSHAVAAALAGSARSVGVLELPGLPEKGDVSDWLDAGGTLDELERLVKECPEWTPGANAAALLPAGCEPTGRGNRGPTRAEMIQEASAQATYFHTPGADPEPYAALSVGGHREYWPLRSRMFRRWLVSTMYQQSGTAPSAETLASELVRLEAAAAFDGEEHEVHTRLAEDDGRVYLDLGCRAWDAVEVDASGWRIVADPPVRFRRARGMRALPRPVAGGDGLAKLRRLVNVASDEDFRLLVSWLAMALCPTGPYPVLAIYGEQGSAKTSCGKLLRALIDANAAPLRAAPRDERDLVIAATNGWVVALDNLSRVPEWLSDALCRLSTGGGFATRELYSDGDETIFTAQRPVILTGIEDVVSRGDLLDRSLTLHLQPIPEDERRPERELWQEAEAARPAILGALLNGISRALRDRDATRLSRLPRMADFAVWSCAAAPAFGWSLEEFLDAYAGSRVSLHETALEADPLAALVRDLAGEQETGTAWCGTAAGLLDELADRAPEKLREQRTWPANARALSGRLKRLAPNLRAVGVMVECLPGRRKGRLITIRRDLQVCVPTVPILPNVPAGGDANPPDGTHGDANLLRGDANSPGGSVPAGTQRTVGTQKSAALRPTVPAGEADPFEDGDEWEGGL